MTLTTQARISPNWDALDEDRRQEIFRALVSAALRLIRTPGIAITPEYLAAFSDVELAAWDEACRIVRQEERTFLAALHRRPSVGIDALEADEERDAAAIRAAEAAANVTGAVDAREVVGPPPPSRVPPALSDFIGG